MQIALTHENYPSPIHPGLRPNGAALGLTRRAVPIRLDLCRLLIATLGLSLYVGLPVLTVAFLGNLFLG